MTICDSCIHSEVCGEEDNHEPALVACANYQSGVLQNWIEDAQGMYRCPVCNHMEGKRRRFCADCGAPFFW